MRAGQFEPHFQHLTTQEGLPHESVTAVCQDQEGFIWLGTKNGLCRYDGHDVEVFRHDPNDARSLAGNHVQTLLVDHAGALWIGTYDGGLSRYDIRTNTFTNYRHHPDLPNSLAADNVHALHEDQRNQLWVGTYGGGLCRYDAHTDAFRRYTGGPESRVVFTIAEDHMGQFWLGTFGEGLYRFDPHEEVFAHHAANPLLAGSDVFALHYDRRGHLWAGTYGQGLFRVDITTGAATHYHTRQLPGSYVISITSDVMGNLWLATRGGGLIHTTLRAERFDAYRADTYGGPITDQINHVFVDRDHVLWVAGEAAGVSRLPVFQTSFRALRGTEGTFDMAAVTAVLEDAAGNLWFGTFGNGLHRYNPTTRRYRSFRRGTGATSLPEDIVTSLAPAGDGRIWVGTANEGLARYTPGTDTFERFRADTSDPAGLTGNAIEMLFTDRQGRLWVGTYGAGLCRLEEERSGKPRFRHWQHDSADARSMSPYTVKTMYEDRTGGFWFGTDGGGLVRLQAGRQHFLHYREDTNDVRSLAGRTVTGVAEDARGRLWVSLLNGTLCRFSGDRGDFVRHRYTESRLTGARSLLRDHEGFFWVATEQGLVRFDPLTGKTRHFAQSEDLSNHAFVEWAAGRGAHQLYFGADAHVLAVDASKLSFELPPPPLVLRRFTLFDTPLQFERPPEQVEEITLRHDDNFFTLHFALLSYGASAQHRYRYRMEGVDRDWVATETPTAPYTNLPAGVYTFRMEATSQWSAWTDPDGVATAAVRIVILPAWYQLWWVRLGTVLLLLGGIFAYYRTRLRGVERQRIQLAELVAERTLEVRRRGEQMARQKARIEEKNEHLLRAKGVIETQNQRLQKVNDELERRVRERTQALRATNVKLQRSNNELDTFVYRASHDIRGPLARIMGLCKVAVLEVTDPKALEYLGMLDVACEQTNQTLTRVLVIYQMRNAAVSAQPLDLQGLLGRVLLSLQSYPGRDAVEFDVSAVPALHLRTDEQMLTTLLNNLCENAIRFRCALRPGGPVRITAEQRDGRVHVRITDRGIGISPANEAKLFTMFHRGSPEQSGTGLGLYLARIAANKIGGTVDYVPQADADMTTFEVVVPLVLPEAAALTAPLPDVAAVERSADAVPSAPLG